MNAMKKLSRKIPKEAEVPQEEPVPKRQRKAVNYRDEDEIASTATLSEIYLQEIPAPFVVAPLEEPVPLLPRGKKDVSKQTPADVIIIPTKTPVAVSVTEPKASKGIIWFETSW